MFQFGKLERLALGAFAATLLMLAATIALARPALLMPNGEEYHEVSAPFRSVLNCTNLDDSSDVVRTSFILEITPSGLVTSGAVHNEKLGTCFSDSPSAPQSMGFLSAYVFTAGGNTCKATEGDVSFSFIHDTRLGTGQTATLTVKDVNYSCRR